LPSYCRQLVDPLGAGDQFIAALAYQRCLRTDWPEAIAWANLAAGRQCELPGCVPLSVIDIESALQDATASVVHQT
jgi:sugar/nucleoside kinase (ribokinase family)